MVNHDEYTDYSCSTSVERLARDVETLLRAWHLVGSDRHVSFAHFHTKPTLSLRNKSGSMSNLALLDKPSNSTGESSPLHHSSSMLMLADESNDTNVMDRTHPHERSDTHSHDNTVRLIRSKDVSFTLSFAHGERSTIPLTLALWDGPSSNRTSSLTDSLRKQQQHSAKDVPHSLQRVNFIEMPKDLFENFSLLFGLGQHITLSPTLLLQEDSINPAKVLMDALHVSLSKRHGATTSPLVTVGVLGSMLQTALNCAASNCSCRIPVFGVWGTYQPTLQHDALSLSQNKLFEFPTWLTQPPVPAQPRTRRRKIFSNKKKYDKQSQAHVNQTACISPLSASLVESMDNENGATFWATVLPTKQHIETSLNEWGRLLMQHCPTSQQQQTTKKSLENAQTVALWGARHVYAWYKAEPKARTSILFANGDEDDEIHRQWRSLPIQDEDEEDDENVNLYKIKCRRHAAQVLEQAWGATIDEPMWGPAHDPLASVYCTITWNGKQLVTMNGRKTEDSVQPLLLLPLRIRSRHAISKRDLQDIQESVEHATLDPFALSAECLVSTSYDSKVSFATTSLAASQRCVLAALIRTASLHPDTLLQHVTNEDVLDEWSEGDFDEAALDWIMQHARVGSMTRHLVEAMTWTDVADHMIEFEEAEAIVADVLDQTSLMFPSPPEQMFASNDPSTQEKGKDIYSPLPKSAPVGRLMSILFVHMSRLRSPSSMVLVWLAFVKELRSRWYLRSSLPNMGPIPGLDPHPDASPEKRVFSTIGVKADYAAFVHCSEPDPDDNHCLVGQKLQVFNICIECTTALELLEVEKMERKHAEEQSEGALHHDDVSHEGAGSEHVGHAPSVASTEVVNNFDPDRGAEASVGGERTMSGTQHEGEILGIDGERGPIVDALPLPGYMVPIREERNEQATIASGSTKLDYCDATEGRSLVTATNYDYAFDVVADETHERDVAANVAQRQSRKGARCPVHGVSLVASGDQLYAPYLQRPNPLTDNTILERKMLLSQEGPQQPDPAHSRKKRRSGGRKRRLQDRVELAQRLQKPKLLSDMRAFKAANPGAVFQDFINWYGNPGNPLDEYKDLEMEGSHAQEDCASLSTAVKLDKASEAIQILNATRDFWSDTWDEASPCEALEQEPLFDVFQTIEMVLHDLETMHPANLVNQIVAVNLSMSYFVLVASAEEALHVRAVESSLAVLREKTISALQLLSRDVTDGTYADFQHQSSVNRLPKHASSEAIAACEIVCDALADAETLLARATTLLHKFPKQYELVQTILRRADGDSIPLDTEEGRRGIMDAIQCQQNHVSVKPDTKENGRSFPTPSLREYMLRNLDEENPCQLCVRYGMKQASDGSREEGGLLIALAKCYSD